MPSPLALLLLWWFVLLFENAAIVARFDGPVDACWTQMVGYQAILSPVRAVTGRAARQRPRPSHRTNTVPARSTAHIRVD